MRATRSLLRVVLGASALLGTAIPAMAGDRPAATDLTEAAARGTCAALPGEAEITLGPCAVAEFGALGAVAGHGFLYGRYAYHGPDGDDLIGIDAVLYERRADGMLHVLFRPEDIGGVYEKPKIFKAAGRGFLHLPGHDSGTGNFNLERLFVWHGAWAQADITDWIGDLQRRLPKGYAVWKGVYPDYVKLTASTPLWRTETDGNCCPTGGRADIDIGWQGDRLVVKSVQVKLGAKYAERF